MELEIVTEDIKEILKDAFKDLRDDVIIEVYTKAGLNDQFNDFTVSLIKGISKLTDKIKIGFHRIGDEDSIKHGIQRSPTVLIAPDKYTIRLTGAPLGEEGRSFIMSLIMASTGMGILSEESLREIKEIKEPRHIEVFVSPTCPYCPQQVLYAVSAVMAKKDMLSLDVIEIYENRDIAEKLGSLSVPQTFINDTLTGQGLQLEEFFVSSLITGKLPEFVLPEFLTEKGPVEKDIVIIGAGPAGLTAAIYAERAGLKTVVLEKANIGGQVAITPVVENYPGFTSIVGKSLVDLIAAQASQYTEIHQGEEVKEIEKRDGTFNVKTNRTMYITKGIILVTGAESKALDVPGEKRLYGKGVSYCAVCDGYYFKDGKKVFVIGGGNSAVTDALYLNSLGAKVTLIHRRDKLRAEARLKETLSKTGIKVMFNSEVKEIIGDRLVQSVSISNNKTGAVKIVPADGIFIAIGYKPNNSLAKALGLTLNEEGYIKVDERMRTSMSGVYAGGDITGGVKQIVVAVSQGSVAALSAFEDISSPYWKKETPAK
ncbi:MAG: FAD-dependent oxidoreductase [Nitrospirae bacterium]|nr:FAD-dependent oxidoreductase [Nitrospirota bacterium]